MLINQEIITIFCNCSYSGIITQDTKEKIFEKVQKFDTKLLAISDLCFASVKKEKLQILNNYKKINIIACYPRAVKWILHNAGVDIDNKEIKYFNMRAQRVEDFNDFTQEFMTEKLCHKQPIFQKNLQWVPWFPVIDYNRCINCRQCVSFCLFGVYHIDEKNRAYVKIQPIVKQIARPVAESVPRLPSFSQKSTNHRSMAMKSKMRKWLGLI